MMFARIDQSPIARWWWTVDRWSLGALALLIGFGTVMSMAASPAVAERLGYAHLHFAERHLVIVPLALATMLAALMVLSQARGVALAMAASAIVVTNLPIEVSGAPIQLGYQSVRP